MNIKLWVVFHVFIIGCATIEVGLFLKMLDENLTQKLANPSIYNTTELFRDIAAYSFNIKRLLRLFKLRRDHVMEAAKELHSMEHPLFVRNFSCEKVKMDFSLTEREYKDLLHFMEKITSFLTEFYQECEQNPRFVGIPLQQPQFSLERLSSILKPIFESPDPKVKKYSVLKYVEDYYYMLGKFTKKFTLGRRAVMDRAKVLFESGGPQFLKHYDYFKMQHAYMLTVSEAAVLDSYIRKIQKRYDQFTNACFKNPNFQSKIDFSSIRIVKICDQTLEDILMNPSGELTIHLFKQVRDFYHVLGFLRRSNIPNRMELLQAMYEVFGTHRPTILKPLNFQQIKSAFQMNETTATKFEENVSHLKRRFDQVQQVYLNLNVTTPSSIK